MRIQSIFILYLFVHLRLFVSRRGSSRAFIWQPAPIFTPKWLSHASLGTDGTLTVSRRCTTGRSVASTNTTHITWRSTSWTSVGTTRAACCLACTPSAFTRSTSGSTTARARVRPATRSSSRHLKEVGQGIYFSFISTLYHDGKCSALVASRSIVYTSMKEMWYKWKSAQHWPDAIIWCFFLMCEVCGWTLKSDGCSNRTDDAWTTLVYV